MPMNYHLSINESRIFFPAQIPLGPVTFEVCIMKAFFCHRRKLVHDLIFARREGIVVPVLLINAEGRTGYNKNTNC